MTSSSVTGNTATVSGDTPISSKAEDVQHRCGACACSNRQPGYYAGCYNSADFQPIPVTVQGGRPFSSRDFSGFYDPTCDVPADFRDVAYPEGRHTETMLSKFDLRRFLPASERRRLPMYILWQLWLIMMNVCVIGPVGMVLIHLLEVIQA